MEAKGHPPHRTLMDHSDRARGLKLAFGTCIIFSRTPDEIYVAADTQQTKMKDDLSGPECTESVCKILKLGTSTYLASSGLAYLENVEVREWCKGVFDKDRSIRENIELIHDCLRDKCLRTITDVALNKKQQFDLDLFKKNPIHVALFGLEYELLVISAIKFSPVGSGNPKIDVCKEYNVGTERTDPSYKMGYCRAINGVGGVMLPDIKDVGIKTWIEWAMRLSLAPHKHPKLDGPDFVILRVGVGGEEEEWPRPSEACKDF